MKKFLWTTLALILLFETWLWEKLKVLTELLLEAIGWNHVKRAVERFIAILPPYGCLVVFLIPDLFIIPAKFGAMWLMAQSWIWGIVAFCLIKVVSFGITAFIFNLTREKLLQIGWFAWLYHKIIGWIAWAHSLVDPYKQEIKRQWVEIKTYLKSWL